MNLVFQPLRHDLAGRRDTSGIPLSRSEIAFLLGHVGRICADPSGFSFNDRDDGRTFFGDGVVHVNRDVFPPEVASGHPYDLLTAGAVLALEWYGRKRAARDPILPFWKREALVAADAAFNTPNLSYIERSSLLSLATFHAWNAGFGMRKNWDMREILDGRWVRRYVPVRETVEFFEAEPIPAPAFESCVERTPSGTSATSPRGSISRSIPDTGRATGTVTAR